MADTIVTTHNTTNYSKVKQPISLESYIYSKVEGVNTKVHHDVIYEE